MKACKVSCIGCGKCEKECPFGAITVENNCSYIDPEKCRLCKKCVAVCPTKAIVAVNFPTPKPKAETPESAEASEPAEAKTQSGTVTTSLDMTGYEAGKVVRAWVPVPTNGDYQTISNEAIVADGATKAELTEDELGNTMAYIEWDASVDPAVRKADVSFHAVRTEALRPDLSAESGEIPAEISEKYLGSSKMVATEDPAVVALAEEITAGKTTCVDKAQAIYDWIYDNMERDNDVVGCGDGDVCRLITEDQRAGKCTDIGSVFIALCRASGVPANEMFGIRMNADDITGNQHCWVEFYAPGIGWVPVDIADVLKAVLKHLYALDYGYGFLAGAYFHPKGLVLLTHHL